ncbi:MAG: hypothetical protein PUE01_04985 [Clostridiaceae bacterium]|nr:hypothetical protein [Clostridiaceae bacterium]
MYDNMNFSVASILEDERKKVTKCNNISFVRRENSRQDEKSKEPFEKIKNEIMQTKNEDVIVESSLTGKIEENKVLEKLVREKILENQSLKDILSDEVLSKLSL